MAALRGRGLWPRSSGESRSAIIAVYDYTDASGTLLYQVVRTSPKRFFQRRPDGLGGWVNKKHRQQVLYHLPEIVRAHIVIVTEGEKDVETLRAYGFVATTNAGGAKAAWLPEFSDALAGKEVILIPDNDEPGRERVARIARAMLGRPSTLAIVELQGAKDVTEWFEKGHSEVELIRLIEERTTNGDRNKN